MTTATGPMAEINPLRYRGYYYDVELEMYYLQSRYYDPMVGRFINSSDDLRCLNMRIMECILDCLIDDDEAYTQIVKFFNFSHIEVSANEIKQTLCEMEKDGYIYVNYEWVNEYGEYPYSLTEKGKKAWEALEVSG